MAELLNMAADPDGAPQLEQSEGKREGREEGGRESDLLYFSICILSVQFFLSCQQTQN